MEKCSRCNKTISGNKLKEPLEDYLLQQPVPEARPPTAVVPEPPPAIMYPKSLATLLHTLMTEVKNLRAENTQMVANCNLLRSDNTKSRAELVFLCSLSPFHAHQQLRAVRYRARSPPTRRATTKPCSKHTDPTRPNKPAIRLQTSRCLKHTRPQSQ